MMPWLFRSRAGLYTAVTLHPDSRGSEREATVMAEMSEEKIRSIVQDELLGIINDAHDSLGVKKDPTGMARKALDGLADLVRGRQTLGFEDEQQ